MRTPSQLDPDSSPQELANAATATEAPGELLNTLLSDADVEAAGWRRPTRTGYTVSLQGARSDEKLELLAPDGRLCLTIRLAPEGARVEVHGAELHLRGHERLRLEADRVELAARETLALHSDGAILQRAGGSVDSAALEHQFESTHGEIRMIANDDVALEGERIRLNSPAAPLPPQVRRRPAPGSGGA